MPQRNVPRPAAVYGIDIGKNVFHVVGLGSDEVPVQLIDGQYAISEAHGETDKPTAKQIGATCYLC